ncbi:MAG: hypothetical protein FWC16_04050 [Defluviitaleaceae bacterium]|nr:hypothetical protein [Defluviitaleaceae bacterium]MCL2274021.1 hypothetical protein [Defluviitaleaceae bacterium]MCL2274078.1 hypothetical protein [Defluviitaleaceae bacterium]
MINPICPQERFEARAITFKERTGRELTKEMNENGEFIHLLHPQSTQKLGFMVEFFRTGFNHPNGFEATIESLSQRYAELREDLLMQHGENEDELYKQLGMLNHAFENALQSTLLFPQHTPPADEVEGKNVAYQLQTFFELFIDRIQREDFDAAFAGSLKDMWLL